MAERVRAHICELACPRHPSVVRVATGSIAGPVSDRAVRSLGIRVNAHVDVNAARGQGSPNVAPGFVEVSPVEASLEFPVFQAQRDEILGQMKSESSLTKGKATEIVFSGESCDIRGK